MLPSKVVGRFQFSDTAISGSAVIHLVQRLTLSRHTVVIEVRVLFHIGVGSSLASRSLLKNLVVMGLAIAVLRLSVDIKTLCGRGTKNDTGYKCHYRDFMSHHRFGLAGNLVSNPPS